MGRLTISLHCIVLPGLQETLVEERDQDLTDAEARIKQQDQQLLEQQMRIEELQRTLKVKPVTFLSYCTSNDQ